MRLLSSVQVRSLSTRTGIVTVGAVVPAQQPVARRPVRAIVGVIRVPTCLPAYLMARTEASSSPPCQGASMKNDIPGVSLVGTW